MTKTLYLPDTPTVALPASDSSYKPHVVESPDDVS